MNMLDLDFRKKNTSEMDVAPWCFKWIGFDGLGGAHNPDNPGSV